jgi:hypothetical protein
VDAEIPHARQLVDRFDAFGDDTSPELRAQCDHVSYDRLSPRQLMHVARQRKIQLDDTRVQVRDTLQVGVASTEVVNHQSRAGAAAQLVEDAAA